MSISANILLFGETLFCQYLHEIAADLHSVNKPKGLKVAKEDQRMLGSMVDGLDG